MCPITKLNAELYSSSWKIHLISQQGYLFNDIRNPIHAVLVVREIAWNLKSHQVMHVLLLHWNQDCLIEISNAMLRMKSVSDVYLFFDRQGRKYMKNYKEIRVRRILNLLFVLCRVSSSLHNSSQWQKWAVSSRFLGFAQVLPCWQQFHGFNAKGPIKMTDTFTEDPFLISSSILSSLQSTTCRELKRNPNHHSTATSTQLSLPLLAVLHFFLFFFEFFTPCRETQKVSQSPFHSDINTIEATSSCCPLFSILLLFFLDFLCLL